MNKQNDRALSDAQLDAISGGCFYPYQKKSHHCDDNRDYYKPDYCDNDDDYKRDRCHQRRSYCD